MQWLVEVSVVQVIASVGRCLAGFTRTNMAAGSMPWRDDLKGSTAPGTGPGNIRATPTKCSTHCRLGVRGQRSEVRGLVLYDLR